MADRRSINVPGRGHRGGAIPMGSRIGNVIYSSGISTADPETGERPDALDMAKFMDLAGGTVVDIIFVMLLLKDRGVRDHIDKAWEETFPDPDSRPARHALQTELGGGAQMQALITAVVA